MTSGQNEQVDPLCASIPGTCRLNPLLSPPMSGERRAGQVTDEIRAVNKAAEVLFVSLSVAMPAKASSASDTQLWSAKPGFERP